VKLKVEKSFDRDVDKIKGKKGKVNRDFASEGVPKKSKTFWGRDIEPYALCLAIIQKLF
jgi:hypothetical protein